MGNGRASTVDPLLRHGGIWNCELAVQLISLLVGEIGWAHRRNPLHLLQYRPKRIVRRAQHQHVAQRLMRI